MDGSSSNGTCSEDDVVSESDFDIDLIESKSANAVAESKDEPQRKDLPGVDPATMEAVPTLGSTSPTVANSSPSQNATAVGAEAPPPAQPSSSSSSTIVILDHDDDNDGNAHNAAVAGSPDAVIDKDVGNVSGERPVPARPVPPVFTPRHNTEGHRKICETLLPILFAVIGEEAWSSCTSRDQIREACWRTLV